MTNGKQGGNDADHKASGKQGRQGKRGARDRLAAERAQQQQAERRRRRATNIAVGVVVLVVAVGIIGYAWLSANDTGPTGAAQPALVQEDGGGAVFGDGPVDVVLWEDFQCPACKAFEAANGSDLRDRVDAGDITLTIHPLSFLDQNLQNSSSSQAANAFGCAMDAGQQSALDYHLTVYSNQPEENPGNPAWSTQDLIGWGNDVGIEGSDWETCVTDQTYAGWVEQVATSQGSAGISSTPTVFVDGEKFAVGTDDLDATIDDALKASQQ